MKIDLVPDRAVRRPDPVEAAVGVFAYTVDEELSAAETARLAKAVPAEADEPPPAEIPNRPELEAQAAPKEWTPKAILTRLTKLYAKFTKPEQT